MKISKFCLLIFFLFGAFLSFHKSSEYEKNYHSATYGTILQTPFHGSERQTGDSPFIRFHHGIDESGVYVLSPHELITSLKLANYIPKKFAGITEYLSSLLYIPPVTREFLYSTPLRSPPYTC